MLYLAIDQHSQQLTMNVRDEAGRVLQRRQVATRGAAVREFLTALPQRDRSAAGDGSAAGDAGAVGDGGYAAIVEVCGFNDWLLDLLPRCGCRHIVLVQPRESSRRKTDRRDANQLGEILWVNRLRLLAGQRVQGLRRVNIPSVLERDDRRLVSLRQRTGRERTRAINRIRTVLRRRNLQHDCPTKTIQTQKAKAWLKALTVSPWDRLELDHSLARWEQVDQEQRVFDTAIAARVVQSENARLLRSLPGAGDYTALGLAAYVGEIGRFPRPRSLANYWGLTPSCHNSGEATQRLGSISKEGSALARFLLGQLVLHVLKRDASLRAWFVTIKRRRGAKIARVAIMRRLTTIIWHMLTHRVTYQIGGVRRGVHPKTASNQTPPHGPPSNKTAIEQDRFEQDTAEWTADQRAAVE